MLHFRTQETGIADGDTEVCLTGQTHDGATIEGCDSIKTVPKKEAGAESQATGDPEGGGNGKGKGKQGK